MIEEMNDPPEDPRIVQSSEPSLSFPPNLIVKFQISNSKNIHQRLKLGVTVMNPCTLMIAPAMRRFWGLRPDRPPGFSSLVPTSVQC